MTTGRRGIVLSLALLIVLSLGRPVLAQDIVVTLLGTGSPTPAMDRFGPSIVVQANNQTLLFDVGRGSHQRLNQLGIEAAKVDAVFFTHLHSDHVVGFPDLWLTGWLLTRRDRPWSVRGPAGTASMAGHLTQAYAVDLQARLDENKATAQVAGSKIEAKDITAGVVYEHDGVRVTAITVDHGFIAPAYGYRIDYGGRSVVLSGDTKTSSELVAAATGVGLFVHEIYQASDTAIRDRPQLAIVKTFHVDAAEAGILFAKAKPKLAVYSHIVLRGTDVSEVAKLTRTTYGGPLVVGEDLMQFIVGDDVTVLRR
jgi:ribonuclease Z